jgi:hypothetical protein
MELLEARPSLPLPDIQHLVEDMLMHRGMLL